MDKWRGGGRARRRYISGREKREKLEGMTCNLRGERRKKKCAK